MSIIFSLYFLICFLKLKVLLQTAFLHKTDNENDKDTRGQPSTFLPGFYKNLWILSVIHVTLSVRHPRKIKRTLNSVISCADACLDKENIITLSSNFRVSPPISEKIRALQNSIRKVLSPIYSNTNTTPCKDLSSNDRICLVLLDPRTPKTPHVLNCDHDENFGVNDTPLDKFNAQSSSLKVGKHN